MLLFHVARVLDAIATHVLRLVRWNSNWTRAKAHATEWIHTHTHKIHTFCVSIPFNRKYYTHPDTFTFYRMARGYNSWIATWLVFLDSVLVYYLHLYPARERNEMCAFSNSNLNYENFCTKYISDIYRATKLNVSHRTFMIIMAMINIRNS